MRLEDWLLGLILELGTHHGNGSGAVGLVWGLWGQRGPGPGTLGPVVGPVLWPWGQCGAGPRGSGVSVGCGGQGHRAYLSSAPHYDFPRYRQLVHEVTVAFSGISREVLAIAGRLRDELGRPDLAQHLARLQEREQEKLQLVGAALGGVSIRSRRLIKTIEAISEILQDLKYDSEEVE
uniref:Required for excision 1-B domain containing n=1 Tax=Serinus canaria TaxID=9135 RepID=A0A8C9NCW2_SERCA